MKQAKNQKQVNENNYMTVEEAAKHLGIKPTAIRNYLYLGKFTTHKFKSLTLLDIKEVADWKQTRKR